MEKKSTFNDKITQWEYIKEIHRLHGEIDFLKSIIKKLLEVK